MSTRSRSSPRPDARQGLLMIKKGQSLPNCSAKFNSDSVLMPKLNFSLSNFSVKAASELPPANPAPMGMALCKCICTAGIRGKNFFNKLKARGHRLVPGSPSISRPVVENSISSVNFPGEITSKASVRSMG